MITGTGGSGAPSWALVGARVRCVDIIDFWTLPYGVHFYPQVNMDYDVRDVVLMNDGSCAIRLQELENPQRRWDDGSFGEVAFATDHFAPVA